MGYTTGRLDDMRSKSQRRADITSIDQVFPHFQLQLSSHTTNTNMISSMMIRRYILRTFIKNDWVLVFISCVVGKRYADGPGTKIRTGTKKSTPTDLISDAGEDWDHVPSHFCCD